jgi:hypothetical protein
MNFSEEEKSVIGDLKTFLFEVKKPPSTKTLREKQYHFLQFTFGSDDQYFGFIRENISIFEKFYRGGRGIGAHENLAGFWIDEKALFDLRYYYNLMHKIKHDFFGEISSRDREDGARISRCYENLFIVFVASSGGRKLLSKLEEVAILGILLIVMKIFYGVGNKTPSLFMIGDKQVELEKSKLGPQRFAMLSEILGQIKADSKAKKTEKLIVKTGELDDQMDILYGWKKMMEDGKFDAFWGLFLGSDKYEDDVNIPINYNDVNNMDKEQIKVYVDEKSKNILKANSEDTNDEFVQGVHFLENLNPGKRRRKSSVGGPKAEKPIKVTKI